MLLRLRARLNEDASVRATGASAAPPTPTIGSTAPSKIWYGPCPLVVSTAPTSQALVAPGRPADVRDVRQRHFNSCHLLASAQAVLAQDAHFVERTFTPCNQGVRVRVFTGPTNALIPQEVIVPIVRHRFRAFGIASVRLSAQGKHPHTPRWPAYLEDAYAQTRGGYQSLLRDQFTDESLTWLTGCATQNFETETLSRWAKTWLGKNIATLTRQISGKPTNAESVLLAHAARAFLDGESVVLHTHLHNLAIVDVRIVNEATGEHQVTVMDPQRGPMVLSNPPKKHEKRRLALVQYTQTQGFAPSSTSSS